MKPNICRAGTRKGKVKLKKRLLSILLAAVMVLTMLPLGLVETAWAASSGTCGDKLTWSLSDDGTLTISGTGDMADYAYYSDDYGEMTWSNAPWYGVRSQVKNIVIESGVTSIGKNAFYRCTELTKVTISDSVVRIGDYAFRSCYSLTGLKIPDNVTSVAYAVFYWCRALTSVTIPDSVTSIGDYAFFSCSSLKNVTIPDSVTQIGRGAFAGCTSLTAVTIPRSVTSIAEGTFSSSGTAVNVAAENKYYSSEEGALYDKEKTTLLHSGSLTKDAFIIPGSVRRIAASAFYDNRALKRITIPTNVTSIGDYAFFQCEALMGVAIPNSVTTIGDYAFSNCGTLTSVTIPNGVTSIGQCAFGGCRSLDSVTISKSVTSISKNAFGACPSLSDVYYAGTASDWAKITIGDGNEDLTNATLHCAKSAPTAPVVKIGNSATSGKPQLTWKAVEGATSYRIYRSTSKGSGYSLLGTTTATSYTNTGAKAGTTYYYRVKACNDAGLSPYSNVVSGKVKSVTPKPAAPVVKIGHSATSGKPMLTWNAVSGATSYKVYRATSQNGTYSLLGTVTATSYTNTGAKAGVTYYYKVKAVNSAGESAYSNTVSGKTTVTTLTMGHSASSGKPQLTWKAVSGAASYKVYRATTKNGAYSVINTTKALTYTNVGAALGTTYYYKVEALNASGKSMGFSAIVEGKVAPVLAVGYSSVSGKPQLTWKAVPGATEYQVYRSTQQNSGYSKINTTTSTSYVNTGAKAGTTYYYKIVAVKGTAASDFSNIVNARPGK